MRVSTSRGSEFEDFVGGLWPRLFRTAFLLTGERHTAEDLVQSTFERVYVSWGRVRRADDPESYTRRILINLNHRRFRGGRREFPAESAPAETPAADRSTSTDDRLILLAALADLPTRQREAVVLRFWEDLSERQTAHAMDCAVGTVKSHTSKALAALRAHPEISGLAPITAHEEAR